MNRIFLFRTVIFIFFCGTFSLRTSAQESYLKAGANLNLSFLTHQIWGTYAGNTFHPVFPGLNFSYEKSFGKQVSWLVNVDLTRQPVYSQYGSNTQGSTTIKTVTSDISLTPEVRFYFLKNQGLFYYKNQGFFLQLGFNICQYEFLSGRYNENYFNSPFTGMKYYAAVPFGFGVKYPLNTKTGMELNIQTNINSIDHWMPLQIGMKFYWLREKEEKTKTPERPTVTRQTYLKAGLALNKTINIGVNHRPFGSSVNYPSYPSINLSYERTCGKRTSFALNLESMKKSIYFERQDGTHSYECTATQFSFIPELRIYLKNKFLIKDLNKGFFLQAGFELFHYSMWTDSNGEGSGFSLYPAGLNGHFERNVPIGFGFKCPVKDKNGVELNFNTNLSEVISQGNNQSFSFGVKYFWMHKGK